MKNEPENEDPQAEDGEQSANLDLTDEQVDDPSVIDGADQDTPTSLDTPCENPNRCPSMKSMRKPEKFNNEHCDVCDRTQRRG